MDATVPVSVPVPVLELSTRDDYDTSGDTCVMSPQDTAPTPQPPPQQDVEAGVVTKSVRKRKTTQNDSSHGSFFLRVGAIGKCSSFIKVYTIFVLLH